MKILRLEDYSVRMRNGRTFQKGIDAKNGKRRKLYGFEEIYKTNAGMFKKEEWNVDTYKIIDECGGKELLEKLIAYCRKNCAWLHKESEVLEYAMECLTSGAYKHWKDFKSEDPPEVIIFLFDAQEVNLC